MLSVPYLWIFNTRTSHNHGLLAFLTPTQKQLMEAFLQFDHIHTAQDIIYKPQEK